MRRGGLYAELFELQARSYVGAARDGSSSAASADGGGLDITM